MAITRDRQHAFPPIGADPVLYILGHVHDDRPGPARLGDFQRRTQGFFQTSGIGDQKDMFGNGTHDPGDRSLLERVGADCGSGHLSADHHDRNRIGDAVADRRYAVGRARPGRDDYDTGPAGGPRVSGSHEAGPLFVGGNDEGHRVPAIATVLVVVTKDGVVRGQNGAATVAEQRVDTLVGKHLHDHLGAAHGGPR